MRSVTPTTFVISLVLLSMTAACSKSDAAQANAIAGTNSVAGHTDPARGTSLTRGTYIVQSAARFRGDTLRLVDNRAGGYSAQLVVPSHGGLYSGSASVVDGDTVELRLTCLCQNGKDGFGQVKYDLLSYDGKYQVRDVGGDRVELRQTDGAGVDTVKRVAP